MVPDSATGFVEIRSPDPDVMADNIARVTPIVENAAKTAGVGYEIVRDDLRRPGVFDVELGDLARSIARDLGEEPAGVTTLPGHDAIMMSEVSRCLMLTVPSRAGLCHHPDEFTDMEDLELGVAWLATILDRLVTAPPAAKG